MFFRFPSYRFLKYCIDRLLAFILLSLLLPILFAIAFIIYLGDFRSPLFTQFRIGLRGSQFKMYKFRSMSVNSSHQGTGYYCYENDPRITKIGRFLRKYSIDELPQLLNIVKGEMSFVGPRPPIHDELDQESLSELSLKNLQSRFLVKPGITGLAQVKYRNAVDWDTKLSADFQYVNINGRNQFLLDLKIIFSTLHEIFSTVGEYDLKRSN